MINKCHMFLDPSRTSNVSYPLQWHRRLCLLNNHLIKRMVCKGVVAVFLLLIGNTLSLEEPSTNSNIDLQSAKTVPENGPNDFQNTIEPQSDGVKQSDDESLTNLDPEVTLSVDGSNDKDLSENKEVSKEKLVDTNAENEKENLVKDETTKDPSKVEDGSLVVENAEQSEENTSSPTKWPCATFNITHVDGQPMVLALSNDEKVLSVFRVMNDSAGCALVLFYSPYCEFSMKMAPLYNMLGRIYRDLAFMAIDAQESMSMAARYGIVGIPTVVLFYSGRAVARYNRSRTVEDFHGFIKDYTGFEPTLPLEIMPDDHLGPLPTKVIERTTLHLSIAMGFLMTFIIYHLFGGLIWALLCSIASEVKSFFVHEKEE